MKIMMAYFENIAGISGGLEKTLCHLSNAMYERGHEISIVVYDENHGTPFYTLDAGISYINLNGSQKGARLSFAEKLKREWARALGKNSFHQWKESQRKGILPALISSIKSVSPDVILAFNYRTMGELYEAHVTIPVIALFRNDPEQLCAKLSDVERESIEKAEAIQVLLPCFKKTLSHYIHNSNVFCIPNAIELQSGGAEVARPKEKYTILHVGRINRKQKRQFLLVKAFSLLASDYPDWNLEMWGSGDNSYKREILKYIGKKNLEERVFFRGQTHNIHEQYLKADIFCFPSRFEGFPNALGEAMSAGLPVVVCKDCLSCTSIVVNGKDGLYAEPTPESLAQVLKVLMDDKRKRVAIGGEGRKAMAQYAPNRIWTQWENLLQQVCELR